MIAGRVDAEGVPAIEIEVMGRKWRAVIDTGFNGDLELPDALKDIMGAKFTGRIHSLLAGGQMIEEDGFRVEFPFDGETLLADATFVPQNEILIGTHLLRRHRLEVNFVQRTVILNRHI